MPTPGVLDPADLRYERYFPPVPAGMPRTAQVWNWQQHRVHVEHIGEAASPVRVILVHGAGGNAAAMWPLAAHLAAQGSLVTVPDLPGYGRTLSRVPGAVRYHHWGDMLADLLAKEADDRPLILAGASIGGLLALDAATRTGLSEAVIATALLDMGDPAVRSATLRTTWLARLGPTMLATMAGPAARKRIPLAWVSRMSRISNEPELLAELLADRRGAGGKASLGWMRSFLAARPHTPPEQVEVPVVLVHGDQDRWTPMPLSLRYLRRMPGPTAVVPLVGSGHFPADEPGLATLINTFALVLDAVATAHPEQRREAVCSAIATLQHEDAQAALASDTVPQPRWQAQRLRYLQSTVLQPHNEYARWLYKDGPKTLTKVMYLRPMALLSRLKLAPTVNLVVTGRRSGRPVSFPLVMVKLDGQRYLVSMLGERANWVHNVRAAHGSALLRHGRTEHVRLVELGPNRNARAKVLQAFLKAAPGARPHLPVSHTDPLSEIAEVAAELPIFRVESGNGQTAG